MCSVCIRLPVRFDERLEVHRWISKHRGIGSDTRRDQHFGELDIPGQAVAGTEAGGRSEKGKAGARARQPLSVSSCWCIPPCSWA